eukprot:jgi/Botrbrau1/6314/Bobra.0339s0024.1
MTYLGGKMDSNNASWLRRKLLEAAGVEPTKPQGRRRLAKQRANAKALTKAPVGRGFATPSPTSSHSTRYVLQEEPRLKGHSLTVKAEEADLERLRERAYVTWPPALALLMKETTNPFINAIYDRDPVQEWVFGRVVLCGEAAHPTTPHGLRATNMAICDAAALGKAISGNRGNVNAALRDFQNARIPPTSQEVLFSRRLGRLKQGMVEGFPSSQRWSTIAPEEAAALAQRNLRNMPMDL